MDDPMGDSRDLTWRERLVCSSYRLMSLYTSSMILKHRLHCLYDAAMIRFWPYDRYPGEWRDLLSGNKNEKEK